jgi:von Willebrand factor type A domain
MEELSRWLASCDVVSPWLFGIAAALTLLLIFLPGLRKRRGLALDLRHWAPRVEFKSRRILVFALLAAAASLLLAAAVAEPQVTVKPSISIYGKPVVAVVDVSGSMSSKPKVYVGGVPNLDQRSSYEKARDIFLDLIGRRPDVNFALELYSTESYIARYFSYKNELLRDTIENKQEIEYISTGTRTADALAKARKFLTDNVQGKDKAIVLISDLEADLDAMVQTAEEMERDLAAGIKIYVIIVTGAKPLGTGLDQVKEIKEVVMDDKAGIDEIVKDLSDMQNAPLRHEEVVQKESLIPFVLLPALLLMLAALVLSETRFRKIP